MRTRAYVAWALSVVFAAAVAYTLASKKSHSGGGGSPGLPAATDWHAPAPMASQVGSNPHAGMNMNNPHAGMNVNNPHAGMDDVANSGLSAPDPDRQIDPSKYLRGEIVAGKGIAAKVHPGSTMFLSAKPIDPSTGEILGPPLAVDRITVTKLPVSFNLTEANMMVAGTVFAGNVVIKARIDQDGDARTRQPGDIEGTVRAKIPAAGLKLVLDTVVQ